MVIDLTPLFEQLKSPDEASSNTFRFSAIPVPDFPRLRLGKDNYGAPSLLIAGSSMEFSKIHPVLLEHLYVRPNSECTISFPNGELESKKFTIISCRNTDKVLNSYFLRVVAPVLSSMSEGSSEENIISSINILVELFRSLTLPSRKTIQGLWAELFIITRSKTPSILINSWHSTPEDRYDFSFESQRLEVKSSTTRSRVHHFSLEQLRPPLGTHLLVASVFVERAGSGNTIIDLINKISKRIGEDTEQLIKINKVISTTLGETLKNSLEEGFDYELAEQSLAFYECSVIPTIKEVIPIEVSQIHFRSDINAQPTIDVKTFRTLGKLFQATLSKA
jgi:hypothetical protein